MLFLFCLSLWAMDTPGENLSFIAHQEFYSPSGLRVGPDGRIYVPDDKEHTVWIFNSNGEFVTRIGNEGQGPGELSKPVDVGFLSDGRMLIADHGNQRIHIYTQDGTFVKMFSIKDQPVGKLVVFPNNTFALSRSSGFNFSFTMGEKELHRFGVFDLEGKLVRTIGPYQTSQNPLLDTISNSGHFAALDHKVVFAGSTSTDLITYGEDGEERASYPLVFEPEEPKSVMKETTDSSGEKSFSMSLKMDRTCLGLAVLGPDEILLLRFTGREDDPPTQLIKVDSQGKLLKIWPGLYQGSHLALSPDKQYVYFLNDVEDEQVVSRLKL